MNELAKATTEELQSRLQDVRDQQAKLAGDKRVLEDELSKRHARASAQRKMDKLRLTPAEAEALDELSAEEAESE